MRRIAMLTVVMICITISVSATNWEWAFSAGGTGWDAGKGIAVGSNGDIYLTGSFENSAQFGSFSISSAGEDDIFVGKLDENGNWLWVEGAGGEGIDRGAAITLDEDDNVYICGFFSGTVDFGDQTLTSEGNRDIFLAKLTEDGEWLWVRRAGGISNDYAVSVATDNNGDVLLTGRFYETADFGDFELVSGGSADVFVAKLSSNGDWLWAVRGGGIGYTEGMSVTIDGNNEIIIAGLFMDTAYFGEYSVTSTEWHDVFVAKLNSNGDWLWAARAGGVLVDSAHAVTIDQDNNIYICGEFRETADFGDIEISSYSQYLSDLFVAKLNQDGDWLWAKQGGSPGSAAATSLVINNEGSILVTGFYSLSLQLEAISLSGQGSFVAGLHSDGNWLWAINTGEGNNLFSYSLAAGDEDVFYLTGAFGGSAVFDNTTIVSSGLRDIFVVKCNYSLAVEEHQLPETEQLLTQNYPNPFNPETTIAFTLKSPAKVRLEIFNSRGQKIRTMVKEQRPAGEHFVVWNGRDNNGDRVGSGVYLYRLSAEERTEHRKMMLLK